jgi:hypothetical protein
MKRTALAFAAACLWAGTAAAAPVIWVDWTSGTSGSAAGVIDLGPAGPDASDIGVSYNGEIQFIQTVGGTNYWTGNPSPYLSAAVDNAPPTPDIIALSQASQKTLTFSRPVNNLFFAVVSLNGNGYRFNEDFTIESFAAGFWGDGTLTRQDLGNGTFQLNGSGEPHGVIRFNRAVSSITWTSLTNENWNGFTVGTYGEAIVAPIPVPAALPLFAAGLGLLGWKLRRR